MEKIILIFFCLSFSSQSFAASANLYEKLEKTLNEIEKESAKAAAAKVEFLKKEFTKQLDSIKPDNESDTRFNLMIFNEYFEYLPVTEVLKDKLKKQDCRAAYSRIYNFTGLDPSSDVPLPPAGELKIKYLDVLCKKFPSYRSNSEE